MQNAGDGVERFEGHDGFGAIVSDLISLVEHVQASINLVERAIAREITIGDHENSNVIILDDVTPQYLTASTALNSCSTGLGRAVQFLLNAAPMTAHPYLAPFRRAFADGFACRAVVLRPNLLVCDEAVSSLDVSIQGQIINLLLDLQQEMGMAMLFISHNLAVVRHVSHCVMASKASLKTSASRRPDLAGT